MIERLPAHARRVRPMTFAYTRPLSPEDVSGITGLLVDEGIPSRRAEGKVERFFGALKARFGKR